MESSLALRSLRKDPGGSASIPRGTKRLFKAVTESRHLAILTPGGFEGFLAGKSRGAPIASPRPWDESSRVRRGQDLTFTGSTLSRSGEGGRGPGSGFPALIADGRHGPTIPAPSRPFAVGHLRAKDFKMRDNAFVFFLAAVLSVTLGMAWGIQMGLTGDFLMAPAHAHLNLVGWATLALFGVYYRLTPQDMGWLAAIHAVVAIAGVVIMVGGMTILIQRRHRGGDDRGLAADGDVHADLPRHRPSPRLRRGPGAAAPGGGPRGEGPGGRDAGLTLRARAGLA